jgi:hypothetical protein
MPDTPIDLNQLGDLKEWRRFVKSILEKPFPPPPEREELLGSQKPERPFSKFSNWTLICEEVLDTEHSPAHYIGCYDELVFRGKSEAEIQKMREIAWLTAGWLNFGKCLWEWVNLNKDDMVRAIEWQHRENQISDIESEELLAFVNLHR